MCDEDMQIEIPQRLCQLPLVMDVLRRSRLLETIDHAIGQHALSEVSTGECVAVILGGLVLAGVAVLVVGAVLAAGPAAASRRAGSESDQPAGGPRAGHGRPRRHRRTAPALRRCSQETMIRFVSHGSAERL